MEQLLIQRAVDYGSTELKRVYQKYVWRALVAAAVLHLLFIGMYFSFWSVGHDSKLIGRTKVLINEWGPPPSILRSNIPIAVTSSVLSKALKLGIPIPVPDVSVKPDEVFPTQKEQSDIIDPLLQRAGKGEIEIVGGGDADLKGETEPPPFVAVEKYPEYVKQVQPKYPDFAMRAGLEGTVWVKIWVDKEGKPKKAVIMKSDAEIFNKPSIEAAMEWVFTPAMMKNGPVAVWVSIPFRYKLTGK